MEEAIMNNDVGEPLTDEKGEVLLELARQTLEERLGLSSNVSTGTEKQLNDAAFEANRGTFITLKINNQLRGCIGNLSPDRPLAEGVRENALNAAFNDPRFPPLTREELESVQIEISLLTEPVKLEYKDADDLLAKLKPGVDGVIIQKGPHSSTFLPQVWEQLPDKKAFLGNLCLKAGLPADEWQKGDLLVYIYHVQYFEETQHLRVNQP